MTGQPENFRRGVSGEAGATPDESRRLHGSRAAAERHRYHDEPLCPACLAAERDYYRQYRRSLRRTPGYLEQEAAAKRQRHQDAKQRDAYDRLRLVDDVAVDRAVIGEQVTLNRAERLAATTRLRQRGMTYQQIAIHLRVDPRQVHRDLAELRLTGQGVVA